MANDKNELRNAYRNAVKINTIPASLLARIHVCPLWQIDKWLYKKDSYVTFQQVFEIYLFIKRMSYEMPVSLSRIILRSYNRISDVIKILTHDDRDAGEMDDKKTPGASKEIFYIYSGERVSMKIIATKFDVSIGTVLRRIKDAELHVIGADISGIDFSIQKRGPKKKS